MPQPTFSDVHVDRPLTNISLAFMQSREVFLASSVFPRVSVDKASNTYWTYDRSFWLRADAQRRAPGTESAGGSYGVSTASYSALRWAIHKDIDDPTRRQADDPLNLDREATEYVTAQVMLRMEIDWTAKYFATGIWDNNPTVTTQWNDAASTPIDDVRDQSRTILSQTGFRPNTLVLGAVTFDRLIQHPDIIDRIKYAAGPGNPAIANENLLAQLFGVSRVLVATAIKNTGAEGGAASYGFVTGQKAALLAYAAPTPGLMTPSAGYTFTWNGMPGADGGLAIKRFRLPEAVESDRVEAETWYDQKVVSTALGSFFNAAVA